MPHPPPMAAPPDRAVLVVEDDPLAAAAVRDHLAGSAIPSHVVPTLFDAVEVLGRADGAVAAIVLDLGLPDAGVGDLGALRMLGDLTDLPVVVHSAHLRPDVEARCRAMGAADVVRKGAGAEALVDAIAAVLAQDAAPVVDLDVAQPAGGELDLLVDAVLRDLASRVPLSHWMLTRVVGDDYVVLRSIGRTYRDVQRGSWLRLSDTLCDVTVGRGHPVLVDDARSDPQLAAAQAMSTMPIRAYCGVPIEVPGLGLFGTLCGLDPDRWPGDPELDRAAVLGAAEVLRSAIAMDLARDRLQRRLDLAVVASRTDALTGLANRRGLLHTMAVEEASAARYGHLAGLVLVDLDDLKVVNDTEGHDAGDRLIVRVARMLEAAVVDLGVDGEDVVFRTGGDEFVVLVTPSHHAALDGWTRAIGRSLQAAGVRASVGRAQQAPGGSLAEVLVAADRDMYREKRARRLAGD